MANSGLEWETLTSHVAYSCDGFDIVTETVQLPDETQTDFDYLSEPESVCVLPFTPDRDVVCIEEWRQAVSRVNFGLPVGTTEPDDDDVEFAARRELAEETGYEADGLDRLVTVEPSNGLADSVMHFFVATDCRPTADQELDHDESIRVRTTAYEDLLEEVEAGSIRDGRAVLAVSYYELFYESSGPRT